VGVCGNDMFSIRQWLLAEIRDTLASLPIKIKVGLGAGAVLFVLLTLLLVVSGLSAFIRPAAASYAYDISEEYGDGHAYYCKHLAMSGAADAKLPLICQAPEMFASAFVTSSAPVARYDGDKYAFGNCTYWVSLRRAQTGNPIPNTWSDAAYWAARAAAGGYTVDHTPSAGAIMQTSRGIGHVAFVENVDPDGTWHISEMNVIGFNRVDYRSMPPGAAAQYRFIH
jgi:hypothetical protein